jgi:hypothetical protein
VQPKTGVSIRGLFLLSATTLCGESLESKWFVTTEKASVQAALTQNPPDSRREGDNIGGRSRAARSLSVDIGMPIETLS